MTGSAECAELRRLTSYDEVLEASGGDPFVRWELPLDYRGPAFALDGSTTPTVAFVRTGTSRRTGLTAIGETERLDLLLRLMRRSGVLAEFPLSSVSLPQHAAALLDRHFTVDTGGDWDWMWTASTPPTTPTERQLVDLDDERDAEAIRALLAEANPTSHAHPGEGVTEHWVGVRDHGGRLVACAALHRNTAGHPHLSGITVGLGRRGTGLGLAMTAALTREGVRSDGVCTLGMFSDNAVARRLYMGLGYRTAQAWSSRRVLAADPGAC